MTPDDLQPPVGARVRDAMGREWERTPTGWGDTYWLRTDVDDDPESWVKVAGNYGPVTLIEDSKR